MKNMKIPADVYLPLLVIFIGTVIPVVLFNGENADLFFSIFTYALLLFILALFMKYLIIKSNEDSRENRVQSHLIYDLNDKEVYLVDYENCSHLPKSIQNTNENTVYYVFVNKTQTDVIRNELRLLSTCSKIEVIYVDKVGKNLLDIGIGMYVGAIYSLFTPKAVNIYSNDRGYNSLIQIAEELGYHNLYNVYPQKDVLLEDEEILKIYKNIKKYTMGALSLGDFKKKIKKSKMNITTDEVNFAVSRLEEMDKIFIVNMGKHKSVTLK